MAMKTDNDDKCRSQDRTLLTRDQTIQPDSLLDAVTFAAEHGGNPKSLPALCAARDIFAVMVGNVPMYPAFFVDPRFNRKQLIVVTKLLGDLPGGSKLQFFVTPKGFLGAITPLDALLLGRFDDVCVAAEGYAER